MKTKEFKLFGSRIGFGVFAQRYHFIGYQKDWTSHTIGLWWWQIYRWKIDRFSPWGHKFQPRDIDHNRCGFIIDHHFNSTTTDIEYCIYRKKDHYD